MSKYQSPATLKYSRGSTEQIPNIRLNQPNFVWELNRCVPVVCADTRLITRALIPDSPCMFAPRDGGAVCLLPPPPRCLLWRFLAPKPRWDVRHLARTVSAIRDCSVSRLWSDSCASPGRGLRHDALTPLGGRRQGVCSLSNSQPCFA